jgi:eukaryotic-like serine/threonine-protein kinase
VERVGGRAEARVEHPRCPYCHEGVRPADDKEPCLGCMAWHHAACWDEHGGCAACGRGVEPGDVARPPDEKLREGQGEVAGFAVGEVIRHSESPYDPTLHAGQDLATGQPVEVHLFGPPPKGASRSLARLRLEARHFTGFEADPGLVRVLAVGPREDGGAYVVVEPCAGTPLDEPDRSLTPAEAVDQVAALARVVRTLHARGLGNLLRFPRAVAWEGGRLRLRLWEPLQHWLAPSANEHLTGHGPLGPVEDHLFMPPELGRVGQVDQRTDVYGLGLVLYRLVTGRHALSGTSVVELFQSHKRIPPPEDAVPDLSPHLRRVLGKALEVDRDRRYADVDALLRDLEALQHPQVEADEPSLWSQRRPPGVAWGAALMLLIISAVFLLLLLVQLR